MTKNTKKNQLVTLESLGLSEDFVPLSAEDTADMGYSQRTGLVQGFTEEQFKKDATDLKAAMNALKELQSERSKEMSESGDTSKYQVISLDEQGKKDVVASIVARVEAINRAILEARDGYMSLLPDLGKLRQAMDNGTSGAVEFGGVKYRNGFKGFCMARFGFSKSTYYNLIKILDYFYDPVAGQLVDGVAEKGLRPTLALIAAMEGKKPEDKKSKGKDKGQDENHDNGQYQDENHDNGQDKDDRPDVKVQRFFDSALDLVNHLLTEDATDLGVTLVDGALRSVDGAKYCLTAYIPKTSVQDDVTE